MASLGVCYGALCETEADCEPDECCVAASFIQLITKGICRKLGRTGSPCNNVEKLDQYDGKYLSRCPCRQPLECVPTGRFADYTGTNLQQYLSLRCRNL
ncbi:hypothetical protein JTE90_009891 [Oedothorax gibbosus]|uniref:Prokineticin domain-containing protein n=1 Tax=Oedothorax gibbosus TaxID=931172 RepID=A0AAV6UUA4_9ARAC|nr:hypothetical protein JTE90_009891 [Oedothorax gibbosus]